MHLHHEIDRLERRLLELGALVEENIGDAVSAFEKRDIDSARRVIDTDNRVDRMEVEVEEECLKLLALYQPVAVDLRFIIAALKINNDLERVGDQAVGIAKRVETFAKYPEIALPVDLHRMAGKALNLLRQSLDAFVRLDTRLAHDVRQSDKEVDAYNREAEATVNRYIKQHPDKEEGYLQFMLVARGIERVGDHATNIAEDIIYMLEGEIVRHTGKAKQ